MAPHCRAARVVSPFDRSSGALSGAPTAWIRRRGGGPRNRHCCAAGARRGAAGPILFADDEVAVVIVAVDAQTHRFRIRPAGRSSRRFTAAQPRLGWTHDDAGQGGGGKRMGTSLAFSYIAESPPPKAPVAGQGAGGAPRCPASGMETRWAETFAAPLTTVRPVGGDAEPPTTQDPQDRSQASPIEVCLSIKACNYSIRGIYYL
jgi:hypothetical protein